MDRLGARSTAGVRGTAFGNRSRDRQLGPRPAPDPRATRPDAGYQDSLPWHELVQVRVVAFQPVLVISSFFPLLCVAVTTVVEL
jgi:hypothetical protein